MVANKYVMHFTIRSVNSQTNLKNIVLNKQPSLSLSYTHTHVLRIHTKFQHLKTFACLLMVLKNWWLLMAVISSDDPRRLRGSLVRNWQKQKIIKLFTLHSHHMCPAWVLQVRVHTIHNWYRSCIFTGQVGDFLHHSINFKSAGKQHHSVWL